MIVTNPYIIGLDVSTNVFYGLQNSLWSNPNNWSRKHVPTSSETATIRANCVLDASPTVDQLVIESGKSLTTNNTSSRTLTVNNNCSAFGTVNLSGDQGHTLVLKGTTNIFINAVTNGTVTFAGDTQTIAGVQYYNVVIGTAGTKTLTGDVVIAGNLTFTQDVYAALDLAAYGLVVHGATNMQRRAQLLKSINNSKISKHIGLFTVDNGGTSNDGCTINLGYNTLEICNGITEISSASTMTFTLGKLKFSTNNQNASLSNMFLSYVPIEIEGPITVTIPVGKVLNVSYINGTTAGSSLVNSGTLSYSGTTDMMLTGSITPYNTSSSAVSLVSTGNWTVSPILTTNVRNLIIGGTGIKKIQTNLTVQGNLIFVADVIATLDLDAYSLTVNGTTFMNRGAKLIKSTDDGKLVKFIGAYTCDTGGGTYAPNSITMNVGTSPIEFCGGVTRNGGANTLYWTYSKIVFSTNSQSINMGIFNFLAWTDVLIKGAITVSNWGPIGIVKISGDHASSKFFNRSTTYWYGNVDDLMPTGILDVNSMDNTFIYSLGSNQTIKGISYKTLSCSNGSIKIAEGNVTADFIVLQDNTMFELGNYNLTVNGTTTGATNTTLSKTGTGMVIFRGAVTIPKIRFATGNPNMEFRGGNVRLVNPDWQLGSGNVKFGSQNQEWKVLVGSLTFNGSVTIEGNIKVINFTEGNNISTMIFKNTVDGVKLVETDNPTFSSAGQTAFDHSFPMQTVGTFEHNYNSNSYVLLRYDGDKILDRGNYASIGLFGTGNHSVGANLNIAGVLVLGNSSGLQLGNYDAVMSGGVQLQSAAKLSKNGTGVVKMGMLGGTSCEIDFSGNPTIELIGGFRFVSSPNINFGLEPLKFSSANQNIQAIYNEVVFYNPVTIEGAINITNNYDGNQSIIKFNNSINGTDAASTLTNAQSGLIKFSNESTPLSTGVLNCSGTGNTVTYERNGDQNIKGATYKNLTLSNSGNKYLQGNVSVTGTYSAIGNAFRVDNGFNFGNP